MQYRNMGRTGLQLSVLSFGTWASIGDRIDDATGLDLLQYAYEHGVNFFDTAETYADGRAEAALGRLLGKLAWDRETFVVSGKVYWGVHNGRPNTRGLGRKHVREGCDATLRRLDLEYLDVLLCHRPDPETPLAETVMAMTDLVRCGKVLYWGTSEWPVDDVRRARQIAVELGGVPPTVEQLQYNLLHTQRVETEFASLIDEGLGMTVWSPLAYGLLTGRYDDGVVGEGRLADAAYQWLRDDVFAGDVAQTMVQVRSLNALARSLDMAPAVMALAWTIRNRSVTSAITGASCRSQLEENLQALDAVQAIDHEVERAIAEVLGRRTTRKITNQRIRS